MKNELNWINEQWINESKPNLGIKIISHKYGIIRTIFQYS